MTTVTAHAPQKYAELDEYINYQIQKACRGIKLTDILTAIVGVAVMSVGYLFLFVLLDHWVVPGGFGSLARGVLLGALIIACLGWVWWRIAVPYFKSVNGLYAAREIEKADPELKGNLLNLIDAHKSGKPVPAEIAQAMEKRAAVNLNSFDVDQAIDRKLLLRLCYALVIVVAVSMAYAAFSPKDYSTSLFRALAPASATPVDTRTDIKSVTALLVKDKADAGEATQDPSPNLEVPAPATVQVMVDLGGQIPDDVSLFFTTDDRQYVDNQVTMRASDDSPRRFTTILSGPDGDGIRTPLSYYIVAGDARSETYRIEIARPPVAQVASVDYRYPRYMEKADENKPGGDLDAYEGTEVRVNIEFDKPISSGQVVLTNSENINDGVERFSLHPVSGDTSGKQWFAQWTLAIRADGSRPFFYYIEGKDDANHSDPEPRMHHLTIRQDKRPVVVLIGPDSDLERPANATIPITVDAHDPDFKLKSVVLRPYKDGQPLDAVPLMKTEGTAKAKPRKAFAGTTSWVLSRLTKNSQPLGLKAGDIVHFQIEARDNRNIRVRGRTIMHNQTTIPSLPGIAVKIIDPATQEQNKQQFDKDRKQQQQDLKKRQQDQKNQPNNGDPQQGDPQNGMGGGMENADPMNNQGMGGGDPMKGDPMNGMGMGNDPMKGDPMGDDPMKGDPMKGMDPSMGDPMNGMGMGSDPKNADPMNGMNDPTKGDPMKGMDPSKGDPMNGMGMGSDPYKDFKPDDPMMGPDMGEPAKDNPTPASEKTDQEKLREFKDHLEKNKDKKNPGKDPKKNNPDKGMGTDPMKGMGMGNDPMNPDPMKNGMGMGNDPKNQDPMKNGGGKGADPKNDPTKGDPMKGGGGMGTDPSMGDPMKGGGGMGTDPMKGDPMKGAGGMGTDPKNDPMKNGMGMGTDPKMGEPGKGMGTKNTMGDPNKDPMKNGMGMGTDPTKQDPTKKPSGMVGDPTKKDPKKTDNPGGGTSKDPKKGDPANPGKKPDQGNPGGKATDPLDPNKDDPRDPNKRTDQPDNGNPELKGPGRKNQHSPKKPDGGEKGTGTKADQGTKGANTKGMGDTGKNPGTNQTAPDKTGMGGGDKKGPGTNTKETDGMGTGKGMPGDTMVDPDKKADPNGGMGMGTEMGDPNDPSKADPMGTRKGEGTKPDPSSTRGDPTKSGKNGPAGNNPADPGSEFSGDPKDRPLNKVDDSSTGQGDKANLEDARKATNLVLDQIRDKLERGEIDEKFLKDKGWADQDEVRKWVNQVQKKLDRLNTEKKPTGDPDLSQFKEQIKATFAPRKTGTGREKNIRGVNPSDLPVPAEYKALTEAYKESVSGKRDR